MMFKRKLFARFLVKEDEIDVNNGSYGRKMISFFQKAKHNFLEQMEKNANGSQNLRKNHGKRWRSETNSFCNNCEGNMERLKEIFSCNHKGF